MKTTITRMFQLELTTEEAERLRYLAYEVRDAAERGKAPSLGVGDIAFAANLYDLLGLALKP